MTETIIHCRALIGRHMLHMKRTPEQLLSFTLIPVVFVLVFGYLFGSAMEVPGDQSYQEYIMAGIFIQVALSNLGQTALGVVGDLENGLMDRFRSLPISRSAVLIGRTLNDVLLVAWSFVLMSVIGLLIGWRVHNGILSMLGGFGLLLLLSLAIAWLGALMGLVLRVAEAVNSVVAIAVMPLSFLSNAFIPLDGLPGWMQTIAGWNPVSAVVQACRELFGNAPATSAADTFPMRHPVPMALFLTVALLAVVVPLTLRAYEKAASRK
ncbi:ABC transporter permease [Streptomyces cinnamoneus]|uniref:Transport permease protein n=1 Tax=Streptomyces cinnamoneus TaxID=53446 RepID=A0A918WNG6_STRCJ|nr:ABC transporter permease [Streptomyces cinnamoneus]GHC63211.1 transport permease protein [Streptomyces cinnamoneus]